MTDHLRIMPALPLSMAYTDSISIAVLVNNHKVKNVKGYKIQTRRNITHICLHFLELVMMCEESRCFTVTSTKVQATGKVTEADESGKAPFDTLRHALSSVHNQALCLLFLTKFPSVPLWTMLSFS